MAFEEINNGNYPSDPSAGTIFEAFEKVNRNSLKTVEKVTGLQLSQESFTTNDKTKLGTLNSVVSGEVQGNNIVLTKSDFSTVSIDVSSVGSTVSSATLYPGITPTLTLVQTDGSEVSVDMSALKDRSITSAIVSGNSLTITKADGTTVIVDVTSLATNTDTKVNSGEVVGTNLVLTNNDLTTVTVDMTPILPVDLLDTSNSNLAGLWKFENNGNDESSNNNTITMTGGTYVDSVDGKGIRFLNGDSNSSQWGALSSSIILDGDFTISFWYQNIVSAYPNFSRHVIGSNEVKPDYIRIGPSDIYITFADATEGVAIINTSGFDFTQRNLYTISRSSGIITGYVNKIPQGSANVSAAFTIDNIGTSFTWGNPTSSNGIFDQFRVYDGLGVNQAGVNALYDDVMGDKFIVSGTISGTDLVLTNSDTSTVVVDMTPFVPAAVGRALDFTQTGELLVASTWMVDTSVVRSRPLPAGNDGDEIGFKDDTGQAAVNTITITPNGAEKIMGVNEPFTITTTFGQGVLKFYATNNDWRLVP